MNDPGACAHYFEPAGEWQRVQPADPATPHPVSDWRPTVCSECGLDAIEGRPSELPDPTIGEPA